MPGIVGAGSSWKSSGRTTRRAPWADCDDVVVEELTLVPPARISGGSMRHVVPLIAVGALVAAAGLGGRFLMGASGTGTPAAPTPAAATPAATPAVVELLEPVEGQRSSGPAVRFRARAAIHGSIHVVIAVGAIVLGESEVPIEAPGVVNADVEVLAPLQPVRATLEVSRDDGGHRRVLADRGIVVVGGAPVVLWHATYVPQPRGGRIDVEGYAPLTVPIVTVSAPDGACREASTTIRVRGTAGSAAAALGLAVFHLDVALVSAEVPASVRLTWTDALEETSGFGTYPVTRSTDAARSDGGGSPRPTDGGTCASSKPGFSP